MHFKIFPLSACYPPYLDVHDTVWDIYAVTTPRKHSFEQKQSLLHCYRCEIESKAETHFLLPMQAVSPTRPTRLFVSPPVDVAQATFPALSTATAPTVPRSLPKIAFQTISWRAEGICQKNTASVLTGSASPERKGNRLLHTEATSTQLHFMRQLMRIKELHQD